MKTVIFSVGIVFSCCSLVIAEDRASLNAQEYDCREYVKECLSNDPTSGKNCFAGSTLQQACYSSPLSKYIAKRASAETDLFDHDCLRTVDGELSGLLTKDSFSQPEIKDLESKIMRCKKSISEELFKQ